jgi:hypothetical protein
LRLRQKIKREKTRPEERYSAPINGQPAVAKPLRCGWGHKTPGAINQKPGMTTAYRSNAYCIAVGFSPPNCDRKSGSRWFQNGWVSAVFSSPGRIPTAW